MKRKFFIVIMIILIILSVFLIIKNLYYGSAAIVKEETGLANEDKDNYPRGQINIVVQKDPNLNEVKP